MVTTKKIQMVDLKTQYAHIKSEIDQSVLNVLESAAFIHGPEVKAFEQELGEYLKVRHVIGCANGTDALQIAVMALDLKPGDEVIVPNFTYIATVEVLALLGVKIVLADVNPDTFNLDLDSVRKVLTPRSRVLMPVHLFGQPAPMAELLNLAREHNLFVIEDNAQAIGSTYTFPDGRQARAGAIGDIGTTSFYPSKNLSCYGDGGALFTNNDEMAARLRMIANHGQNRRYYFDCIGVNSRLDSIQAAILRIKLRHLDAYTQARQAAAAYYDAAFAGLAEIKTPARAAYSTHVFHQYTMRVLDGRRDALQEYLTAQDIPSVVFYPLAVHQQTAYQNEAYRDADYPNTLQVAGEVLSLPMHTELDEAQLAYIVHHVKAFFA